MVDGNANYTNTLLTMTLEKFLSDKAADTIFQSTPLIDMLKSRSKTSTKGGTKLLEMLMYAKNTTVGSYAGYDPLDVTPQEGFTNAEFDWKEFGGSLAISQAELDKNSGEPQVASMLEAKWEQLRMSLEDEMNRLSFLDGTGNGSKDPTGLALMVDSAGTYGNIVRSANSWWASIENASGGVLQIEGTVGMKRTFNQASYGRAQKAPNLGITTQIAYEAYEALMAPYLRYSVEGEANAVFKRDNLKFRGMPLFWDGYCQSGIMYMLNTDFIRFVTHSDRDFKVRPFMEPANSTSKVALITWMGNLTCSNCRHQAKITGITNS